MDTPPNRLGHVARLRAALVWDLPAWPAQTLFRVALGVVALVAVPFATVVVVAVALLTGRAVVRHQTWLPEHTAQPLTVPA